MPEPTFTKARLIPVSGIGSVQEAEQRATSALLAVLSVVRDLSLELLTPLGASRARKAVVETFIEVHMPKTKVRPDGLIRVEYGKASWSCFLEVKTGDNRLSADQVNSYWELAREWDVDHVLTISNEIAPKDGVHPTDGLRVRKSSKVQVSHISWSAIVAAALRIKQHKGVTDPEQAWILDELIRYLEHNKSGALDFSDMGQYWVAVRDGAREGNLSKRTEGIEDVTDRWDQLIRFTALRLSAEIGEDVSIVIPRGQNEARHRNAALVESLSTAGTLSGGLRIPNTAGNLSIDADLRARQLTAWVDIDAPQDKGAVGRVSWLAKQLSDASRDLVVEAYPKGSRTCTTATLEQIREDRQAVLDGNKEPFRFRVVMRSEMGAGRKTGTRSPGFISTVLSLVERFYGEVVQQITPWQAPAPKLKQAKPVAEPEEMEPREYDPFRWAQERPDTEEGSDVL
jgi:hypothetical protein